MGVDAHGEGERQQREAGQEPQQPAPVPVTGQQARDDGHGIKVPVPHRSCTPRIDWDLRPVPGPGDTRAARGSMDG
ncbi:hypothetical protein KRM28CT15_50080 [Krasilnikovia sp. M28-CT-15]